MSRARIFLAGDSAMAGRPRSMAPMAGWGQALPLFLRSTEVINAARPGASSRSFLERGRLAWILRNIARDDLLLVSFGLIDMKPSEGRFTEPFRDYQDFLRRYALGARERGAHPVFVTCHERRVFDPHGNMRRPLGLYPAAMRELAGALSVPLVDLNEWSVAQWRRHGPDGTRKIFLHLRPGEHPNYPDGVADNTHLRTEGAVRCARFVAREMHSRGLLTPEHFRDLDTPVPETAVDFADDHVVEHLIRSRVGPQHETGTVSS